MAWDSELTDNMETLFDTRDKAFMFIKIFFPTLVSSVNLEGSPYIRAAEIYSEFERQGLKANLKERVNQVINGVVV